MHLKTLAFAALAASATLAQAQLTVIGDQTIENTGNMDIVDTSDPVRTVNADGSTLTINATDVFSGRTIDGLENPFMTQSHVAVVEMGNIPVRLNSLELDLHGKFVWGGGQSDNLDVEFGVVFEMYEYIDDNTNGIVDSGDILNIIQSQEVSLGTMTEQGLVNYDLTVSPAGFSPYIMGANTSYLLNLANVAQSRDTPGSGATAVWTFEYPSPDYRGHTATFTYEAVPEPTTLLLGLPALALLKRRKKRA